MLRLLLSSLLVAAVVVAQEKVDSIFQVWDANGDGELTPDEIPDEAIFAKVDADKDGKITRAEVAVFLGAKKPPPPPEKKKGAKVKKADEKKTESAPMLEPRTVKERVADFFRRFDQNKDKKIQKKEFQAGEDVFKDYDRNRNSALSEREVTRYVKETLRDAKRRPNPNNFFNLFDMNRDKKVTRREYDGPANFFRMYDHDKDRVVTEGELNMGANAGRMMEGDRDFMADGPTRLPKQGLLERYDADKDGRITLEELKNAESVMKRLDKNGDGVLSGGEVR